MRRHGLQWSHGSGGVSTGKICLYPAGLVKLHRKESIIEKCYECMKSCQSKQP